MKVYVSASHFEIQFLILLEPDRGGQCHDELISAPSNPGHILFSACKCFPKQDSQFLGGHLQRQHLAGSD